MLNKLLKLANRLDKNGLSRIANEIDELAKIAGDLSPEDEEKIDEKTDDQAEDPEWKEKQIVEEEYGLNDDDMFGIEPSKWHNFKWSFEGYPKDKEQYFKPHTRYQTVILDGEDAPEELDDQNEGGKWELQEIFDKPTNASLGEGMVVYKFLPFKEQIKRMGPDEALSPEAQQILDDEIESTEDVIDTDEKPSPDTEDDIKDNSKGGVHLF